MTDSTSTATAAPSVADSVRSEIAAVAATATAAHKKALAEIVARARDGAFSSAAFTIAPPVAALLFLEHNRHNRDWHAEGPKSCREYARRMTGGQWKRNNASIGFYVDGELEDGQHRLSAAAIAGYTLECAVVFGIERDAIETVDDGRGRHGADHAKLSGVASAKAKQTVVKIVSAYLVKAGDSTAALRSEAEIHTAIKVNDKLLDEAIEIGANSLTNIVEPVLKAAQAHALAYLMLTHAWPTQRVREKLAAFQTGVSSDGEKTPYFVAAEYIKVARDRSKARERLTTVKELGVVMYAMTAAESGVKALGAGALKAAVKQALPNPSYVREPLSEAA